MIHLIYDSTVYLNIDKASYIGVETTANTLNIHFRDYNEAEDIVIDVCNHPKVKELINSYEEKEQDGIQKYICFKVLEIIIDRLSKTDEKLSPIINLESVLNTIHKKSEEQEQEEREVIPVTVDKDGNVTKVLTKENNNEKDTTTN